MYITASNTLFILTYLIWKLFLLILFLRNEKVLRELRFEYKQHPTINIQHKLNDKKNIFSDKQYVDQQSVI